MRAVVAVLGFAMLAVMIWAAHSRDMAKSPARKRELDTIGSVFVVLAYALLMSWGVLELISWVMLP